VCQSVAGALLLARPSVVARLAGGPSAEPPAWVLRLLGARLLGQGGATLRWPASPVATLGAAVDTIHAVSMIVLAGRSSRYRRPALVSAAAAIAAASCVALASTQANRARGCSA
jgi:hypothetical protein